MAQSQIVANNILAGDEIQILACNDMDKRKVNLCLGNQRYISVFKNDLFETVINIRKGTRSVSISKDFLCQICDLKETILMCCAFTEGNTNNE